MSKTRRFGLFALVIVCVFAFFSEVEAQSKKKAKKSRTSAGVTVLTISDLAKLPLNRRAEYVRLMRESFVDFEAFQLRFRKDPLSKSAQVDEGYRSLFAAAFGPQAFADPHQQRCPNQCIYAFHLKTYEKVGGQCQDFPLGCERPQTCQMGDSKTNGYQCEGTLTGLSGSQACVSQSPRVTRSCYQTMTGLADTYKGDIDSAVNAAAQYFGLNVEAGGTRKTLAKEALAPGDEESQRKVAELINRLVRFAYDDRAYAQLIGLVDLYDRAGVSFPPGVDASQGGLLASIKTKFNGLGQTVDAIFADYTNLCDTPLSPEVVEKLQSKMEAGSTADNIQTNAEFDRLPDYQKGIWKRRMADLLSASQPYTNRNVLQKEECLYVSQRLRRLKDRTAQITSTRPEIGQPNEPKPPVPTLPQLPDDLNSAPVALGCPSAVERERDNLYMNGARCAVCAAEKAVHNSDKPIPFTDSERGMASDAYRTNSDYRVSRKWTSLVSTMAVACGTGRAANSSVDPIDVMWYLESFGHCDSDIYDWHTSNDAFIGHNQEELDAELVERWTKRSFWLENSNGSRRGDKSKPEPDLTVNGQIKDKLGRREKGDFIRIYGISYEQATSIFCNPENFDGKVNKRGKFLEKIKGMNRRGVTAVGAAGSRQDARNRMAAALEGAKIAGGPINNSPADGLLKCLKKSKDLAERVYPASANTCMVAQDMNAGGMANLVAQSTREDGAYPGNFIWTGTQCFVGDAVQVQRNAEGQVLKTAIGLQDPSEVFEPNRTGRSFDRDSRRRFDRVYRMFEKDEETGNVRQVNALDDNRTGTYKAAVVGSCRSAAVQGGQRSGVNN